jgi:hypothetical protein
VMPAKLIATANRVASRWTAHKAVAKRSSSAVNAGGWGFSARVLTVCAAGCTTDRGRTSCSHAAPVIAASATTTPASNNDRPPGMPIV